ncbi:MAG: MFS transporter [bacterium]
MFQNPAHKKTGLQLITSIWFLFCAQACVVPHLTRFYDLDLRLPDWQIGMMMALPASGAFLVQPFWGYLADRGIGRTRAYRLAVFLAAVMVIIYSLSYSLGGFLFLLSTALLFQMCYGATSPLSSALILSFLGKHRRHLFGKIRVWGSLSFMLTMFFITPLLVQISTSWNLPGRLFVFWGACLFYLIAFLSTFWDETQFERHHKPQTSEFLRLFQNPNLLILYGCIFLTSVGMSGGLQYIGPYVGYQGYSEFFYSSIWFIGVGSEVLLSFWLHSLVKRFGLKPIIIFGFMAEGTRWLGISLLHHPAFIEFFYTFHGPSVIGVFFASAMYLDSECDESIRSTAQTLLYFSHMLGQVTGFLGGSLLVNYYTGYLPRIQAIQYAFFWFGVTGWLASLIFIVGVARAGARLPEKLTVKQ